MHFAPGGRLEFTKPLCLLVIFKVERVKGIEPSSQAWEARILPLNHTRLRPDEVGATAGRPAFPGHLSVQRAASPPRETDCFYQNGGRHATGLRTVLIAAVASARCADFEPPACA
jgi:hypothetical protein